MYSCEYNEERALGVWVFRGGDIKPAEWEAHFRDVKLLTTWHGKAKYRPAVVMLMLEGVGRPDAVARQRLAELTAVPQYNPHLAIVTSNPLIRGALTALRWLQKTSHYDVDIFSDHPEAIRGLEQRRGHPLPELTLMVARGRTATERPAKLAR